MNALTQTEGTGGLGGAHADTGESERAMQYLTFSLNGAMFAIRIMAVREIIEYGSLTAVPMVPACIRGVINLRGAVVPVLDLSVRFGRESSSVGKRTCIVIVEMRQQEMKQVVGVVVDAVSAVRDIPVTDIEPPPAFGARIRSDFIQGMGKVEGRFVMLLDIDKVLSVEDIGIVSELTSAAEKAA